MTFANIESGLPDQAVTSVEAPFPRIASGKVREIFDLGDALLLVASDRLSAFDVILPDGIPGKGILLTQMSLWWFERTSGIISNHLLPDQEAEFNRRGVRGADLRLRSMIVRKLSPLPIECVVRGYLAGSGWSSYAKTGSVCGIALPAGLRQADRLPRPIFTPTTKAPKGSHDEAIDDARGSAAVGAALYERAKAASMALYQFGHDRARDAGMILADTKFEFGTDSGGAPRESYEPGRSPPSYDKQFVRDHLLGISWDQRPPAPRLPASVIAGTRERYLAALRNLMSGGGATA
jgi:phosphoribosylaminoimidazole-succinocarboxamide synthase